MHFFKKLCLSVSGTVAIYLKHRWEIAQLHDGSMFGEIQFHIPAEKFVRFFSFFLQCVAVGECVQVILSRAEFLRITAE